MNIFYKLQYYALKFMTKLFLLGGVPGLKILSKGLGATLWYVLPKRRRKTTETIMHRLELSKDKAKAIARASFDSNALSFLELLTSKNSSLANPKVKVDDLQALEALKSLQRPIMFVSGHLGAWEHLAGPLAEFLPANLPCMMVVRKNSNPAINQLIFEMRGASGATVVGHRDATFAVLKALKRKGCAAFLVDHNCRYDEALFLPFLGKIAAVNAGPALLAVRSNAVVIPAVLIREEDNYVLKTCKALDCAELEGTIAEKIGVVASYYTMAMEKYVQDYPEQWFWMHNRWKTQPKENISE